MALALYLMAFVVLCIAVLAYHYGRLRVQLDRERLREVQDSRITNLEVEEFKKRLGIVEGAMKAGFTEFREQILEHDERLTKVISDARVEVNAAADMVSHTANRNWGR